MIQKRTSLHILFIDQGGVYYDRVGAVGISVPAVDIDVGFGVYIDLVVFGIYVVSIAICVDAVVDATGMVVCVLVIAGDVDNSGAFIGVDVGVAAVGIGASMPCRCRRYWCRCLSSVSMWMSMSR